MAKTYDLGRLFFAPAQFVTTGARAPLLGLLPSQQTDHPYRHATALMVRVPFTRYGIIAGWWRDLDGDIDAALLEALYGRGLDLDDVADLDAHQKVSVRELIAQHAEDPDDEWQLLSVTGLDK